MDLFTQHPWKVHLGLAPAIWTLTFFQAPLDRKRRLENMQLHEVPQGCIMSAGGNGLECLPARRFLIHPNGQICIHCLNLHEVNREP